MRHPHWPHAEPRPWVWVLVPLLLAMLGTAVSLSRNDDEEPHFAMATHVLTFVCTLLSAADPFGTPGR